MRARPGSGSRASRRRARDASRPCARRGRAPPRPRGSSALRPPGLATRRSAAVSPSTFVRPPMRPSSARAFSAQAAAPISSNCADRRLDRVPRGRFWRARRASSRARAARAHGRACRRPPRAASPPPRTDRARRRPLHGRPRRALGSERSRAAPRRAPCSPPPPPTPRAGNGLVDPAEREQRLDVVGVPDRDRVREACGAALPLDVAESLDGARRVAGPVVEDPEQGEVAADGRDRHAGHRSEATASLRELARQRVVALAKSDGDEGEEDDRLVRQLGPRVLVGELARRVCVRSWHARGRPPAPPPERGTRARSEPPARRAPRPTAEAARRSSGPRRCDRPTRGNGRGPSRRPRSPSGHPCRARARRRARPARTHPARRR